MPTLFQKARDPISSYSHFIGAGLSFIGLIAMSLRCAMAETAALKTIVASLLFCISLIALYSASGIYHYVKTTANKLLSLRKLDHAMIYVLIAGSYTPVLLTLLPGQKGVFFTAAIWTMAAAGILLKLCWMNAPRWLGTSLYILMGWTIVVDLPALSALSSEALTLLAGGGVFYTIGGLIYLFKWPNFTKAFGFHELFHIFVILGSVCHYFMVLLYMI